MMYEMPDMEGRIFMNPARNSYIQAFFLRICFIFASAGTDTGCNNVTGTEGILFLIS